MCVLFKWLRFWCLSPTLHNKQYNNNKQQWGQEVIIWNLCYILLSWWWRAKKNNIINTDSPLQRGSVPGKQDEDRQNRRDIRRHQRRALLREDGRQHEGFQLQKRLVLMCSSKPYMCSSAFRTFLRICILSVAVCLEQLFLIWDKFTPGGRLPSFRG